MNPGDTVHYREDIGIFRDKRTGTVLGGTSHQVGRFVGEVQHGKKKGKLIIKHGGKYAPARHVTIDRDMVIKVVPA